MKTRDFSTFKEKLVAQEHDACAIVASIRTSGEATHGNLKRTMEALGKMGHRSGDVQSEGDGCGVLTDIPRRLWSEALEEAGRPAWLAEDKRFFVGHLMIPNDRRDRIQQWKLNALSVITRAGADLLLDRPGYARREALGRLARAQEPRFWQVAGIMNRVELEEINHALFEAALNIEHDTPIHVASLSSQTVVYKVRGTVETLYHYYPELRSRDYTSAITIGHARYSTNTTTAFERVQPFSLLGHNGEINTISRLREQARMLGIPLVRGGSDSQDLNRILEALIHRFGFSLLEALELAFPPILLQVDQLPQAQRAMYRYYRRAFGPYAQGPAAIVARYGDECACSADALGLRPLWIGETDKEIVFSSEKGVVPLDLLNGDPKPLAPGEKFAVRVLRDTGVEYYDYNHIRQQMLMQAQKRLGPANLRPLPKPQAQGEAFTADLPVAPTTAYLAAFGWNRDDCTWAEALGTLGKDPIASLGYDGPLAALSDDISNVSDYCKEKVAVVTNPAIDREREQEHFSMQVVVGPRPSLMGGDPLSIPPLVLDTPVLVGGHAAEAPLSTSRYRTLAEAHSTLRLEDAMAAFSAGHVTTLHLTTEPSETVQAAITRLSDEAIEAALGGAALLVLDDSAAFTEGRGWIDPHIAIAAVDTALRETKEAENCPHSCRRNLGLVVRSAALRNLHDIIMALGLGADAVAPYLLLEVALGGQDAPEGEAERVTRLDNALYALCAGLEKVISTMGTHEVRGYGRIFAGIGLSSPLANVLNIPNYAGSAERGLTWSDLDKNVAARQRLLTAPPRSPKRTPRLLPLVGKPLRALAQGEQAASEAFDQIRAAERKRPGALRHILDFAPVTPTPGIAPEDVDGSITGHSLPFVIASMSFGSQGEVAFRAYAEAAARLNILALNGEGGEIADLMGKYPHNRGQQIASGRFGVNIELLNASNLLEIKIGQGAKPGEGGHLPGRKVSPKVAEARHVSPGIDLISPSNNHDIYSIEDLAQFIEELKTANPKARVAVKVPVVPGIGVIAVGIAKAGANIINLTGFDGGTGAARAHSIQHVGLPSEIGLVDAHRALLASNMRKRVEIWADGGVRSPDDVVKWLCLGADRVGFGTLPMIALGCLVCRNCKAGTCPLGITTQIETVAEATERGLKRFTPQDFEQAVERLVRLFEAFGHEVKAIAASLGVTRLQDLVGRSDLLEQRSHQIQLNLREMLTPATEVVQPIARPKGVIPLRRPRNHLTTVVSNLVMEAVAAGESIVAFEDDRVTPVDRALGTHLAGALTRYCRHWDWMPGHNGVGGQPESWRPPVNGNGHNGDNVRETHLRFYASSVPGNGLGAFIGESINITVEGGAQDGVGKGLYGGKIVILKGYNHDGVRIDGAVGKSLAYGAIKGLIIVQGNADSRACIRLSGADVIIGGEIKAPINDTPGFIGTRANIKGFLCEYMTAGRVLVLGDPGPWMCAGMTGGVLYLQLQPHWNLDEAALRRRIAQGAEVGLKPVEVSDGVNLRELLKAYAGELDSNHQHKEAEQVLALLDDWEARFVKIVPLGEEETALVREQASAARPRREHVSLGATALVDV